MNIAVVKQGWELLRGLFLAAGAPRSAASAPRPAPREISGYKAEMQADHVLVLTDGNTRAWTEAAASRHLLLDVPRLIPNALAAYPQARTVCVQRKMGIVDSRGHVFDTEQTAIVCFTRETAATVNWRNVLVEDIPGLADHAWQAHPRLAWGQSKAGSNGRRGVVGG